MGCCLGRYASPSEPGVKATSEWPLNMLRTGDLILFVDKRHPKLYSHVAAVVFLPTLFPSDPVLILESVEGPTPTIAQSSATIGEIEHEPLIDKLTNRQAVSGSVRLVGLRARLQQLPKDSEVLLKLVHNVDTQLELQRRQGGGNGVSGGFAESDILSWINNYQSSFSLNTPAGVTFDFLASLGISGTTTPKRLNIGTIVQGDLFRRDNWTTTPQLFSIQVYT